MRKRRHLLETLEPRQLLAGPQLIGIQPNEGDLIDDGVVRSVAPRALTFRFDETQVIHPDTLDGIRITRAGADGQLGTTDDLVVQPALVTLGDIRQNEVVMRFAENLPDDHYRIEVFAFDDPAEGIVALRNTTDGGAPGEPLVPRTPGARSETIDFRLALGAQVEAVVPQPVVRLEDGSLQQRRDEILVYFNEDELFVENDPATGLPTERSAEHPRFYQLLLTQETVSTADDELYWPERVIYDAETHTARLMFQSDLNELPGVPLGGGTFRLRIGTAVDHREDLIVAPNPLNFEGLVVSDLGITSGLEVEFRARQLGAVDGIRSVSFIDSGLELEVDEDGQPLDPETPLPATVTLDGRRVIFDLRGVPRSLDELQTLVQGDAEVDAALAISWSLDGTPAAGGDLEVPLDVVDRNPLFLDYAGDDLQTAADLEQFAGEGITSLIVSGEIVPQPFGVQLPGSPSDPGRLEVPAGFGGFAQAVNERFGPDSRDGITEVDYNFRSVYAGGSGTGMPSQLNNITETQKRRVREALGLWGNYLGVQFRETRNAGMTIAVGNTGVLTPREGTQLHTNETLRATMRIDPTFEHSALVLSNQVSYRLNYGEDFFRKAMAGIGFMLGLEKASGLPEQTLMALSEVFLNESINPEAFLAPRDPFAPLATTRQQSINDAIDSQTIPTPLPNALDSFEPIFPGNLDIMHGQFLHRPDSIDVDLYRFEVDLGSEQRVGTLTAETFAERLADSSSLDTTLSLFRETKASAVTDFGMGSAVSVQVESLLPGELGNRSRLEFIQSTRLAGDTAIRVTRINGEDGNPLPNAVQVDMPRRGPNISSVSLASVIDAINNDPFASTLFRLSTVTGQTDTETDISGASPSNYSPLRLTGGKTERIARNDNYTGNDSLLTAQLGSGVYYIGVSASGNDLYDPAQPDSSFGGRTQGRYDLQLVFRPQVNQTDVIRDRDNPRPGVPGTALDGNADGVPGGEKNFWFQTRPEQRKMEVTVNGAGIVAGQTMTISGADGVQRRFEFVPFGQSPQSGNIPISFEPGPANATPSALLADRIRAAVQSVRTETGVSATVTAGTSVVTLSGERSLQLSSNFRGVEIYGRTLFVDKVASVVADGSQERPFNNIASTTQPSAFTSARARDIVRIVGNGGQDNDLSTPEDNFAYQIGLSEVGGTVLNDGRHMDVPRGVTVMIDAGAAFKLRGAAISVGSNNLLSDRSGGALQVLGTPRLVHLSDPVLDATGVVDVGVDVLGDSGKVIFTSTRDRAVDAAAAGNSPAPGAGNWGGIIFRRDFDQAEGRRNLEDEGIFLQTVNHADIRYGGGSNIVINSVQQTVNPIQMINLRPTVTFNRLRDNAGAAMSASPNTFQETRYQEPRFQQSGAFTADYDRVGPDIKNNRLTDNSINGLFIRTEIVAGEAPRRITVPARFDNVDIVHYIAENVVVAGQPGGAIRDGFVPDFESVTTQVSSGGRLDAGTYQYRMTFVDRAGFESLPSEASSSATVASGGSVQLLNLPVISSGSDYNVRRLYRLDADSGQYRLIAQLNRTAATFIDDGSAPAGGAVLDLDRQGVRGRINASLVIDPNVVVKFNGARLELDQGTQLLAEGLPGQPVVMTSVRDDRYGAGGTFDTNNDSGMPGGGTPPQRGDWSGIYAGPTSLVSLDNAVVAYGGGVSLIEGGQSRGFLALELQQASGRVTGTRFEYNDNGQAGSGPVGRNGRLAVTPATIFVRGSQPVIVGNEFVDNFGSIIDIDLGSLTDELVADLGRQTGPLNRLRGLDDNHGPLVRRNETESTPGDVAGQRQLNGMRVRGGDLTGGSVWDDTDIVHVLFDSVNVGNQVSGGALKLKSRPDESLVIKMLGGGTPNSATLGTGFTATGSTSDIPDRIGGTIHVLGMPGAPVVFTSLKDDTVGAGRRLDGTAQTDTNGDGFASRPTPNDWRSLYFDSLSNDRNVAVLQEQELSTVAAPGLNSTVTNAQQLGDLAERLIDSDDQFRLGFEVHGFLSGPGDIDTYAFTGVAGTPVWIDLSNTSFALDSVLEILDDSGNVLARSTNGFAEVDDPSLIQVNDPGLQGRIGPLADGENPFTQRWESGLYANFGSTNPRDAGLRLALPGSAGTRSNYFVRVRSSSTDPADSRGGRSMGAYTLQVRLQEGREFPGSSVRFADIRYANHGIHVQGLPGSSPLLGEVQENEAQDPSSGDLPLNAPIIGGYFGLEDEPGYPSEIYADNGDINGGSFFPTNIFGQSTRPLGARPQYLGNLVDSKIGTISVGGSLHSAADVDFYRLDVRHDEALGGLQRTTVFDMDYADGFDRPDTNLSIFYSPTGNPGDARLVLLGQDSNILDDRSSPLESSQLGELLARGSVGDGDPFIGPVSLPQGSYFVAVTSDSRLPQELQDNPLLRREPIDSVLRIFDDHVEAIGGSTALPPRERNFVSSVGDGWSVTTERAFDLGHRRPATFEIASGAVQLATAGQVDHSDEFDNQQFAMRADELAGNLVASATGEVTLTPQSTVPEGIEIGPQMTNSTPLINLDQFRADPRFEGIDGAGYSVVVMDTGITLDHPFFGPDTTDDGVADRIVFHTDFFEGNDDGTDFDGHGTQATSIIASSDETQTGVAPGVNIIHLKVFPDQEPMLTNDAVLEQALQWVVANAADFNIAAVNMSLGGGNDQTAQLQHALRDEFAALAQMGVLPIAASGNSFFPFGSVQGVAFPSSDPDVISVGAVYSSDFGTVAFADGATDFSTGPDHIASFSQRSGALTDTFAPGPFTTAAFIDGGVQPMGGTSAAAPHVTGAAVLAQQLAVQFLGRRLTVDEFRSLLDTTGVVIVDGDVEDDNVNNTGLSFPRLDMLALADAIIDMSRVQDNESYRFDRSADSGTLTSSSFDLTGYVPADLPRFYFDYLLVPAGTDEVVVRVRSDEHPSGDIVAATANRGGGSSNLPLIRASNPFEPWRQLVIPLNDFAGHTGITIEFDYQTGDDSPFAEGLYVDNFIVGFAERGEMISGARPGRANFVAVPGAGGSGATLSGEYQLEIRDASRYGKELSGGVLVERYMAGTGNLLHPTWIQVNAGRETVPDSVIEIEARNAETGENEIVSFQFVRAAQLAQFEGSDTLYAVRFNPDDTVEMVADEFARTVRRVDTHEFYDARRSLLELTTTIDTNDRLAQQVTLIAPAGDQITDGSHFTLGDGNNRVTFEFSTTPSVGLGHIRIPYSESDSAAEVARRMITVINSGTVQGAIDLRASTSGGLWDFSSGNPLPTDARVALHGSAVGRFQPVAGLREVDFTAPLTPADDGSVRLSAVFHEGRGDRNTLRTQGQFIIDSNRISDARAIGIWSDPGYRATDPDDERAIDNAIAGSNYMDAPPVGNSPLGARLNLPTLNDSVVGGLAPGVVIENNIVDQAGFTGIKVDGETRPMVIEWDGSTFNYASGNTVLQSRADILVPDGFMFAIDAGGTRVVFEFEDISGAPTNLGGSGQIGGDGFVDGHVPIYYRLGQGQGNNRYNPSGPDPIRSHGYSAHELMMAIYEAIQGSVLVTNGLVQLAKPTLGPSVTNPSGPRQRTIGEDPVGQSIGDNRLDAPNPALYIEGVTGIYTSRAFQKQSRASQLNFTTAETVFDSNTGETFNGAAPMVPIYEAPQPLAKVVNNTVYGSDGTEGAILEDGSLSRAIGMPTDEPNDTILDAVDTKLGKSQRGAYIADGEIGDNVGPLSPDRDVDFFKVEMVVGDRLIVDIDTQDDGPTTQLRLFDAQGIEVARGEQGSLPEYLKPGSSVEFPRADPENDRDGFIDFTALETGTYYIGVSSQGNDAYESLSLAGRRAGSGGTGAYTIGIEVLAPRSHVLSLDNHPLTPFGAEVTSGTINGTLAEGGPAGARSLVGTTFTISQIPDYLIPTRPGDAYAGVNADGNRVTFEFTSGVNSIVLGNGNINVPILTTDFMNGGGGYRVPDIMRAIANAVNGYLNNPALPNHEVNNGPDGRNGPVTRVKARALGGSQGDNTGIRNFAREEGPPLAPVPGGGLDFTNGFGHVRRESGGTTVIVPDGTFTDAQGSSELYVLIENAAKIELSPEARAAGLKLGPDNSRDADGNPRNTEFASESDQLLTEFGILVSGGASAALLNNVVVNAHQSIVQEETSVFGFGGRIDDDNPDRNIKPGHVVSTGNAIQFDEYRNTQIRSDLSWWVQLGANVINRNPVLDGSISTDLRRGPSNVAGGNSDFNFVVRPEDTPGQIPGNFITRTFGDILENPAGGRFTPAPQSPIIDSAVDSIEENTALADLKNSVGISAPLIVAPQRDNTGQLRADDPESAPPGGIGADVFKDRGALDRADFVGPVATLEFPLDNDAAGVDTDPAESFLNLSEGTFDAFRILLQDLGDSSDPFVGTGIDPATVRVSPLPGLRAEGANFAVFEGDRLLVEGVDYTFSYDTTRHLVTLTPLAGVWRNDRAYRIAVNNRDRHVVAAPAASGILDGDSFQITGTDGARLTFEFESGFELRMPEVLRFAVPDVATGTGGIIDGMRFSLTGSEGDPVFFEFNLDDTLLPDSREVRYAAGDSAQTIAAAAADAIQQAAEEGLVDVDVRLDGSSVLIGSEAGTVLDASRTALNVHPRTLGLRVPEAGTGAGGIEDGDLLVISDGFRSVRFELLTTGAGTAGNIPINVGGLAQPEAIRNAIFDAIDASPLRISPQLIDDVLYLNLPHNGSVNIPRGALATVGLSRTPDDGSTITFSPLFGAPLTFVLDRTDDDQELPVGERIEITRLTTADELASAVAEAIRGRTIPGVDPQAVLANPGGQVAIGGQEGLGLELNLGSTLDVIGTPGVTGSSLLTISGPLLLQLPTLGGTAVPDDSQFFLTDGVNTVTFQYNLVLTGQTNPQAVEIPYRSFDDVDTIAEETVQAINDSLLELEAEYLGDGRISLGLIAEDQFGIPQTPPPADPDEPFDPVIPAPLTPIRGIVEDGEQVVITQGDLPPLRLEFDAATGGGAVSDGFIPVPFQPGSTIEDIAEILAAAINNNRGAMEIQALVESGGRVRLVDNSQTTVDVSAAPTVLLSGTPGGAIPVRFNGAFGAQQIKAAIIAAINDASGDGLTSLIASNRGGATMFIENALLIEGPLDHFFLQTIKDLAGNPIKPNRQDNSTQFTILLPTVGLDFGDAPDPRDGVPGRYPTLLANDGARHIVDPDGVRLGRLIDVDADGMPSPGADGDDTTVFILGTSGPLFDAVVRTGFVEVNFNLDDDPAVFDGNTVTISTGVDTATLEFDVNGLFNEEHFAVTPLDPASPASIAEAFRTAVLESPLRPADVVVVGDSVHVIVDDEDGVEFTSERNPFGVLNPGMPLDVTVTVTGSGVLEAWIDFNFDGDWDDPNEQIIGASTPGAIFSGDPNGEPITRTFTINVPPGTPRPTSPTPTFARFRISGEGGLSPRGLALSGEVEDYRLMIMPGLPPEVTEANSQLQYEVDEDNVLQASDVDGTLTPNIPNDDGILAGITDPDGDPVGVFADDVGERSLIDADGEVAGELNLRADGTFTFVPTPDYFGEVVFTARVTDLKPQAPETQLISPTPLTVTITVNPVNDPPFVVGPPPLIERTIAEDTPVTFAADDLTAFYAPGPPNEADQPLIIQSAGIGGSGFQTELGGILQLVDGDILYTPPLNFPGPGPDRFNYVVADVPGAGQISETAETLGTVLITITPVNDPPIVGNNTFEFEGEGPFTIPISGPQGILSNDLPGPPDEVAEGQELQLVVNQFPKGTQRGGTVRLSDDGQSLIYTPPANFSGPDQFSYTVTDTEPPQPHRYDPWIAETATGTVFVNLDGDNLPPQFVGPEELEFDESKETEQVFDFNLNSWFVDPEGDPSTFEALSTDPSIVTTTILVDPATGVHTLRLRLRSFQFTEEGQPLILRVTATNIDDGPSTVVEIPVTVNNTPDPPILIGSLDPLNAMEDETIQRDLSEIFFDPDRGTLTYRVSRIGEIVNPSAAQIAASGLVESVQFVGDQMTINLIPDAFGSTQMEVMADDGMFTLGHEFSLNVSPVPDPPRGEPNFYNVPIGGRLQVLNPAEGVLSNDTDPDPDVFPGTTEKVRVHLPSVTQPSRGTLEMNIDGTFIYTNTSGAAGDTDTFTYRPIDPTGLLGNLVTVTLNIGRSQFQNPIPGQQFDVNADGVISPLDALLVLNLLASRRTASLPVAELTGVTPPFYDVNGDGFIQPIDALLIITEIARRNRPQSNGEGESSLATAATTELLAAAPVSLPRIDDDSRHAADGDGDGGALLPTADLMADFGNSAERAMEAADELVQLRHSAGADDESSRRVDEALLGWMDPTNL